MRIKITLPQSKGDMIHSIVNDLHIALGPTASVEIINQPSQHDIEVISKNPLIQRKIRLFFRQNKIPFIMELFENLIGFKTFLENTKLT